MPAFSELVIDSQVDELARARGWLTEHAHAAAIEERMLQEMNLVLSEACANVIRHAYKGQAGQPIELHITIDDEKVVLQIRDQGIPFDAEAYHPPDHDEPHEGGYGVFIIQSLMDEVNYDTSTGVGTTLRMVKYRNGATRPHSTT